MLSTVTLLVLIFVMMVIFSVSDFNLCEYNKSHEKIWRKQSWEQKVGPIFSLNWTILRKMFSLILFATIFLASPLTKFFDHPNQSMKVVGHSFQKIYEIPWSRAAEVV